MAYPFSKHPLSTLRMVDAMLGSEDTRIKNGPCPQGAHSLLSCLSDFPTRLWAPGGQALWFNWKKKKSVKLRNLDYNSSSRLSILFTSVNWSVKRDSLCLPHWGQGTIKWGKDGMHLMQQELWKSVSISQCRAHGSHLVPFCCLAGWKDFSLGAVASRCRLSSVSDQVAYSRLWTTVRASVGSRMLSSWIQGMHLSKVRNKVKRIWRNFLSGQNAIISPRATNLLGRGSWFACAPVNQLYLQVTKSFSQRLKEEVLAVPGLCLTFYYFQSIFTIHDLTRS